LRLPEGSVAVGFAGSMKSWHGVVDLIDAMAHPQVDRAARLVLIGSGPQASVVEQRIAERSLTDRVAVMGQVGHEQMPSLLAALDIGVAPYLPDEDFYFSPLKVLEYLAAGLPVICPALGDLPDIVADAGVLYEPGDVDDLARAIGSLVGDPAKRRALAARSRTVSRRWTWDANAQAYVDLAAAVMISSDAHSDIGLDLSPQGIAE
jgi:glycosyltransferase involved in cell wall biosynthesis